jgi:hypothetical protein
MTLEMADKKKIKINKEKKKKKKKLSFEVEYSNVVANSYMRKKLLSLYM